MPNLSPVKLGWTMFIDDKLIGSETSILLGIKTCHHYKSCIHLESSLVRENQSHLVK